MNIGCPDVTIWSAYEHLQRGLSSMCPHCQGSITCIVQAQAPLPQIGTNGRVQAQGFIKCLDRPSHITLSEAPHATLHVNGALSARQGAPLSSLHLKEQAWTFGTHLHKSCGLLCL